jgi:hypothetical protein
LLAYGDEAIQRVRSTPLKFSSSPLLPRYALRANARAGLLRFARNDGKG